MSVAQAVLSTGIRPLFAVIAFTGLRFCEVAALSWVTSIARRVPRAFAAISAGKWASRRRPAFGSGV